MEGIIPNCDQNPVNSPSFSSEHNCGGGGERNRRRRALIHSSSDEDDNHEFSIPLEDTDYSSSSSVDQNSAEKLKRKRKAVISSSVDYDDNREISSQNPKKIRAAAQPLIRSVWTGTFNVCYDESIYHRRVYSFNAFLSSKASARQRDLAAEMEAELCMEMMPKPYVWPRSFRGWGPTENDIAVYLFPPSKEHERLYDMLVREMIECDLGMRIMEEKKPEIRIFTSHELPFRLRKFQGKYYLWGTFL